MEECVDVQCQDSGPRLFRGTGSTEQDRPRGVLVATPLPGPAEAWCCFKSLVAKQAKANMELGSTLRGAILPAWWCCTIVVTPHRCERPIGKPVNLR